MAGFDRDEQESSNGTGIANNQKAQSGLDTGGPGGSMGGGTAVPGESGNPVIGSGNADGTANPLAGITNTDGTANTFGGSGNVTGSDIGTGTREPAPQEPAAAGQTAQAAAYTLRYVPAGQPAAFDAFTFMNAQSGPSPVSQGNPTSFGENGQAPFDRNGQTPFPAGTQPPFPHNNPAAFQQVAQAAYAQNGQPPFVQNGQPGYAQNGQPGYAQNGQGAFPQNGHPAFNPNGQPLYYTPPANSFPQGQPQGYPAGPRSGFQPSPQAYAGYQQLAPHNGPVPNQPHAAGQRPSPEQYEDLKTAPFYNESYRKPGKGRLKGLLAPMILIGLSCSILGGAVSIACLQFFGLLTNSGTAEMASNAPVGSETVRKVEIVDKTDSPVTAIAEKAGPSVVGINVEYTYNDSFFGTQDGGGQGSGIIISADGYILTNNHVVEAAANSGNSKNRFANSGKITVILPNQKDHPYEATIVGLDAKTDIAIIKIDATNLPVAEIGDSDKLKVGEMAVAIGNPAGLEYMGSVTEGIISGLNREVDTGDGKMLRLIQTDAAISPGNSGGALLNSKGQVVGVNSSKIGGESYEGLGFAIPIKDAMTIAGSLMKNGIVIRPQIGVSVDSSFTADVAKANSVPEGILVGDVMTGSSAEKAGVLAGDIITKFNGVRVTTFDALEEQKNLKLPGDKVTVEVYRIPEGKKPDQGEYKTVNMELGSTADVSQ